MGDIGGFAWGGGVTSNPSGYGGIGWISMNSMNCDADGNGFIDNANCGAIGAVIAPYAVNIPTSNGDLSGYAWSGDYGWISFNASDVVGCPSGSCSARRVGDDILGWARILSIRDAGLNAGGWQGWVSLSDANAGGNGYGLKVSQMDMTGGNPTYAYSDELGWIDFSMVGRSNALTICEGPHMRKLIGGPNIPLPSNGSTVLTARYGSAANCSDPVASVTWSTENTVSSPDDAISLPSTTVVGSSVVVTANANNTATSKSENVVATYNLTTVEKAMAVVTCPARTCFDLSSQTASYCPSEIQNLNNACGGTVSCPGTRNCNYNFKEVNP